VKLKATKEELEALLVKVFPQVTQGSIVALAPGRATVRWETQDKDLRPGGTVSGPTMFGVADLAFYIATMGAIGPEAMAVTTQVSINFMRKPSPGPLIGEARILKLGRALCVGDVLIYSEGVEQPVAHASVTYSIPPR
jgi:uncharacterized protein (TIGR00369 family)